jgi:adenine-specific DNA-methyltransferase
MKMEKLKMHSINKVDENIEKIGVLFPNALTEVIKGYIEDGSAIVEHAIDFDVLRQELSSYIVEGPEERYQFSWPDKKKSILLANAPIAKTLRPCLEESVDFDSTENLYIEGDNLDVLKLLQETYLGKVKMIYIDPPYNTGNDFVYEDDFAQETHEYMANSGQYDEEGNRLVQNTESNGRFHTDWLNMMYPRLKLAKDLLSDNGVIFISIDDYEIENLKKVCTQVFGSDGFLSNFVWKRRTLSALDQSSVSTDHEYVLAYKNTKFTALNGTQKDYKGYANPDNDPRGIWTTGDLTVGMNGDMRPNQYYDLIDPKTGKIYKPNYNRVWAYIPESMEKLIADNRVIFPDDTSKRPMLKRFAGELKSTVNPFSTWMEDVGLNTEGTRAINALFHNTSLFNYAKPISLIHSLIAQSTRPGDIVLDFFSGSATTAHAVMQLNAEDGGNRKFIMVQLPEETDEKSEAYKTGYKNICEIGKERIRRAGKKILVEHTEAVGKLDIGFRVLKVDSTNMQDVYYNPAEYRQDDIDLFADNIKPDRSPEDLLFQVMLDLGVLLSSKIEETVIAGKKVFNVAEGYLMACFDTDVTSEVIIEIAKKQPYYAVFRDSSIESDSVAINFEQIFETYSPTTVRKVL